MKKKILRYLQTKRSGVSISEIAREYDLSLVRTEGLIKALRDTNLIKATDGWGEERYTNIKITTKGMEALRKKKSKSKETTTIYMGNNHGNISVGNDNKQSFQTTSKKEAKARGGIFSQLFWWAMGIAAPVVGAGIIYYLGWK